MTALKDELIMNKKQKTCLTEELTKEEREELISKIEGIANRNIKYHVLISETQRLIMKKAVPKLDYDKLKEEHDFYKREYNKSCNENRKLIDIWYNSIPKEKVRKMFKEYYKFKLKNVRELEGKILGAK